MPLVPPLDERAARYDRLQSRVKPLKDGGRGLTMAQAGQMETPPLTRARVSAILKAGRPVPAGRPPENDSRENLRRRMAYWERRRSQASDPARLAEIEVELAGLTDQIART